MLEDVRAARVGRDPELAKHVVDRVLPVGGGEQPPRRGGDRVEHGIAASQVLLGELALGDVDHEPL